MRSGLLVCKAIVAVYNLNCFCAIASTSTVKRDTIYYQIFKRFPELLFELADLQSLHPQNYRFDSVEVKETSFRIDGVFLPVEGATPRTIIFAEVQFQKDESLYHRFFTESLTYLYRNQTRYDDWYGILIFPSRTIEPSNLTLHRALLNSSQVYRIYLEELDTLNQQSLGLSLLQLPIASDAEMIQQAKQLIARVGQASIPLIEKDEIIEVISTIAIYKFSNLSREEVESMLGQSLQETRVYQEAKAEGKAEMLRVTVPLLMEAGMSVEQIAQRLDVDLATVQKAAQQ
ncbi:Rpn family recombination-promoting nuclease/putative transposase [Phormidesmis sp. 146-33]